MDRWVTALLYAATEAPGRSAPIPIAAPDGAALAALPEPLHA